MEVSHVGEANGADALCPGDLVRLCLAYEACSRFLVRKLFRELVSETAIPADTAGTVKDRPRAGKPNADRCT